MSEFFFALGLNTPTLRFAATTAAVGLALTIIQPEIMFIDGKPKSFSYASDAAEDTTVLPWYAVALFAGGVAATRF